MFHKQNAYTVFLLMEGATSLFFALIFTVNMVYQVTVVHLNPLQLVLVGTLLETIVFIFEIPTGIVADVYSRRLSIIIGLLLIGFGFAIEGLFPVFGAVLLAQILWGLGATFTSGATQAWISDEVGEKRAGKAFIRGAQMGQIGGLIGIGASVLLGSIQIQIPIVLSGILFVLLGSVLIVIMPETGFAPTPREDRNTWQTMGHTLRGGIRLARLRPILLTLLGISAVFGLYSEGVDRLWTAHLLEDFTFPTLGGLKPVVWFGIINVVSMLLSIVATEILRRRVNTNDEKLVARVLIGINAATVVGILVFALTGWFGVALSALWMVQVLRGAANPLFNAWLNQHLESSVRATMFSMTSQLNAIGQIVGGPVVGYIGTAGSLRAALTTSGLILTPVLWLFARGSRQSLPIETIEAVPASAD
jgi:DHA3 family tetracycline resistance protein-like MFS transporter